MPRFRFEGFYPAYVQLPDGRTVHANPGEVLNLDTDTPGPAWSPATDSDAPAKPRKPRQPATEQATTTASTDSPDSGGTA